MTKESYYELFKKIDYDNNYVNISFIALVEYVMQESISEHEKLQKIEAMISARRDVMSQKS
jgi:hypothetical protein